MLNEKKKALSIRAISRHKMNSTTGGDNVYKYMVLLCCFRCFIDAVLCGFVLMNCPHCQKWIENTYAKEFASKGGNARKAKLSKERLSEIGKKAVQSRILKVKTQKLRLQPLDTSCQSEGKSDLLPEPIDDYHSEDGPTLPDHQE
jgi:hypothetical protein